MWNKYRGKKKFFPIAARIEVKDNMIQNLCLISFIMLDQFIYNWDLGLIENFQNLLEHLLFSICYSKTLFLILKKL